MPSSDPADGVVVAVGLVAALRRAGLAIPPSSSQAFVEALGCLDLTRRSSWYWAGRTTLVQREAERAVFDAVVARFLEPDTAGGEADPLDAATVPLRVVLAHDDPASPAADDPGGAGPERESGAWSAVEVLSDKDFAGYTPDEWAEATQLMARLGGWGPRRRTRRHVRARGTSGGIDRRMLVRQAVRHDREGGPLPRRRRTTAPRRVVLLLDVSRSMDPYGRAYLRFAHGAVTGRGRVEAFSIGTRLTRLTRLLRDRDADRALASLGPVAQDWASGTRLGEGLHRFNQEWGVPGMARGAVVVLFSDGWEQGEVELLSAEMERLARVAHRVVWVNPLKATDGYEPLARGMAAALPFVDRFVEGHSLRSLLDLGEAIDDAGAVRPGIATGPEG